MVYTKLPINPSDSLPLRHILVGLKTRSFETEPTDGRIHCDLPDAMKFRANGIASLKLEKW